MVLLAHGLVSVGGNASGVVDAVAGADLASAFFLFLPSFFLGSAAGAGLPAGSKLWSKAGWTGWTHHEPSAWRRHDAAYVELPNGRAVTLVVFTQGRARAENVELLPEIARRVAAHVATIR